MEENTKATEALNSQLEELTHLLKDTYSTKTVLWRGVINGIGTFIGATIVAALMITIFVQVLEMMGLDEYFQSFLPK